VDGADARRRDGVSQNLLFAAERFDSSWSAIFNGDQVLKTIQARRSGANQERAEAAAGHRAGTRRRPGTRARRAANTRPNLPAFEEAYHVPNLSNPDSYALEVGVRRF